MLFPLQVFKTHFIIYKYFLEGKIIDVWKN